MWQGKQLEKKLTAKSPRPPRKLRFPSQQIHLGELGDLAVNPHVTREDIQMFKQ
jgi:hypothetical protein